MARRRRRTPGGRAAASAPGTRPVAPVPPAAPGAAAAPSAGVFRVETADEARALARYLLDPDRTRPVVLLTRAAGQATPSIDPSGLEDDLRGLAEVWEMPTGTLSWAFSREMPPLCEVYGGAARVYPPSLDWTRDPYRAPLRFVYGPDDAAEVAGLLTADAMRAVRGDVVLGQAAPDTLPVQGTVLGVTAGRGIVQLTRGASGAASIWTELVVGGVAPDRVLQRGMAVSGLLDPESRRLDVSSTRAHPRDALAGARVGDVVPGLVRAVERTLCVVDLFPDFPVAIEAVDVLTTSREVDLRVLITEGEVVAARVVERGDAPEDWRLSLVEVGPGEVPLVAPAILPGGPPWLMPPDADEDAFAALTVEAPAPAPPSALPPSPPEPDEAPRALASDTEAAEALRALTIERDNLMAELQRQREAARQATHELTALRTGIRKATRRQETLERELRDVRAELGRSADDGRLFADPLRQLRFEVELAWARRITADEKPERPLAPWTVGPNFFASWDEVHGVARAKVVDVIVEVLTGLAFDIAGRELHQLRVGPGGDDPPRIREDGATCWRVSLQVRTPSARRLHYWQLNDGSIELASIRLHDDLRT